MRGSLPEHHNTKIRDLFGIKAPFRNEMLQKDCHRPRPHMSPEPAAACRRQMMESATSSQMMESQMSMDLNRVRASEPSYFNFLMTNRNRRRTAVPFAQAVGVLPDLVRDERVTRYGVRVASAARAAYAM